LARAHVADWREVDEMRWEAPAVHRRGERVSVDARTMRGGGVRMAVRRYRTAWRRAFPDVTVPSLHSAAAARVFDRATEIAVAF